MRKVWVLAARELRMAFRGPVAFASIGVYLLLHGFFFVQYLEEFSRRTEVLIRGGGALDASHNLMDMVAQRLVMADSFLLLLVGPALSMRLLADEWRTGTGDLLRSYPLRGWQVILGKFLAAGVLVALMIALGMLYPLSLAFVGRVELPMLAVSSLGLLLYGLVVLAVGTFFSALTENQIIAFTATLLAVLVLTMSEVWAVRLDGVARAVLQHLSLLRHVVPSSYGVLQASDVVYFLSLGGLFLFLATGSVEGRGGRGVRS